MSNNSKKKKKIRNCAKWKQFIFKDKLICEIFNYNFNIRLNIYINCPNKIQILLSEEYSTRNVFIKMLFYSEQGLTAVTQQVISILEKKTF